VRLNRRLEAVNSNDGGRGSRDFQYCLGRWVGGLRGGSRPVKIWQSVRYRVNGVNCVDLEVNSSRLLTRYVFSYVDGIVLR
jgi:hypothetical protein